MDDYNKTIEAVRSHGKFGMKLGLDNIRALMQRLGNPQKELNFIHIAGSNGKGSTVKMLESVLHANRIRTGAYTSPELIDYRERFRVDEDLISQEDFLRLYKIVDKEAKKLETYPTAFEIETAIAILYFKEKNCELVLWETGLGGRLDATNVIDKPLVSIITPISLEHTKYLGDTLSAIAKEKAAIIKDSPVVIAPQEKEALDSILEETSGPVYICDRSQIKKFEQKKDFQEVTVDNKTYPLGLIGSYQSINLLGVLKTLQLLEDLGYDLDEKVTLKALKSVSFPGRFEILQTEPLLILDGAHNPHGLNALKQALIQRYGHKKFDFIFSQIKEKDFIKGLKSLTPLIENLYIVDWKDQQALDPNELKEAANKLGLKAKIIGVDEIEINSDTVVTGSLYLLSYLRSVLLSSVQDN